MLLFYSTFVPFNLYYFHFSSPAHSVPFCIFALLLSHMPCQNPPFFFLFCFYLTRPFFSSSYSPLFVAPFSIFHSRQYLHLVMQCKRTSQFKQFYTNVLLLMAVLSCGFCSYSVLILFYFI